MAKILVPAVLPGEQTKTLESSDGRLTHIRSWPDGTEEYDRGGMGIFIGPPTDAVTGRKTSWDEVAEKVVTAYALQHKGKNLADSIGATKPLAGDNSNEEAIHGQAGVRVPVQDVEAGLRTLGLYDGRKTDGHEDGVWGSKADKGLEKLLIMVQKENGVEISGAYNEETARAMQKMASQGRISQGLVDGLKDLDETGRLAQMYGPHDVLAVLSDLKKTGQTLPVADAQAGGQVAHPAPVPARI